MCIDLSYPRRPTTLATNHRFSRRRISGAQAHPRRGVLLKHQFKPKSPRDHTPTETLQNEHKLYRHHLTIEKNKKTGRRHKKGTANKSK